MLVKTKAKIGKRFRGNSLQGFQASGLIVAYEPVCAIGTGKNCRPEDVKKAMETIKNLVGDVKVLYGGSVKADNAQEYLEVVDGFLVGGASLNAEEFIKIVEKGS